MALLVKTAHREPRGEIWWDGQMRRGIYRVEVWWLLGVLPVWTRRTLYPKDDQGD